MSVTLPYLHRKTMPPTPDMGERFNQHLEPHGEYMTAHPQVKLPSIVGKPGSATGVTANEYGDVTFKNPLVIRARPDEYIEWKRDLSIEHGGRVGEALSDRLRSLGHDGIIVTHNGVTPGEMVNLGGIKKVTQEGGKLPKLDHGAADHDKDIWVVHDTEGL